ncbi:MAG: hypothetical protein M1496_00045 [Candidatus Thermoplasmatota archaeon]|jgi:hypothetical protein|nr:hypothetical protein [Candidatus Thermoplasmatota archaeon]
MKLKKVLYFLLALILITSLSLSFDPLIVAKYDRRGMNTNPFSNGSFFFYEFSAPYAFVINKQISNSTIPMSSIDGIMKMQINGSNVDVQIDDKLTVGGILTYTQNSSFSLPMSSEFIKILINNVSLNKGTVVSINDQLIGKVLGTSQYTRSLSYNGNNRTLKEFANNMGFFDTTSVSIINFNTSCVPRNYLTPGTLRSPNEINYGQAVGTNILVFMQNSGNSGFLDRLYSSSNTTLEKVYGFNMELISSNVAISPLSYSHYIEIYLPLIVIIWILTTSYIIILYYRVKKMRI